MVCANLSTCSTTALATGHPFNDGASNRRARAFKSDVDARKHTSHRTKASPAVSLSRLGGQTPITRPARRGVGVSFATPLSISIMRRSARGARIALAHEDELFHIQQHVTQISPRAGIVRRGAIASGLLR